MNLNLFYQGLIELGLSLLTGFFVYFVSFKVFIILTKDIDELEELKRDNIAVAVLISSFIFGIMIILKAVISPAMDTLGFTINAGGANKAIVIYAVIRIVLFYLIAGFFSFVLLWMSIKLFMTLTTQIDEMKEIKANNAAISLILASLIISLSIILLNPFKVLLDGLVAPPVIIEGVKEPLINYSRADRTYAFNYCFNSFIFLLF